VDGVEMKTSTEYMALVRSAPSKKVRAVLMGKYRAAKEYESSRQFIKDSLRDEGWVYMYSAVLDDRVVVLQTEQDQTSVPDELRGCPTYTADEILDLRNDTMETLRGVHTLKTIFPRGTWMVWNRRRNGR
jgi:hypothetical protein